MSRTAREVTVLHQESCDDGPFNFGGDFKEGTLNRVLKSLIAIRESIPAEFRATASCEISSESGYEDSHYPAITVRYMRPETLQEAAECEARDKQRRDEETAKARIYYEELKKRFES